MTNRRLFAIVILAIVASQGSIAPREAMAQTASEVALARQWFADGRALEDKGDWAAALEQFKRAAEVKRTPQIVFHLGLCASRTGKVVQAVVDLDLATTLARAAHVDDVVTAATAELIEVRKRVATLDVRVEGKDPVRFVVDGQSVALAAIGTAMLLDPGEHTITVELASGARATQKISLAPRDAQRITLVPESGALHEPASGSPPLSASPSPPAHDAPRDAPPATDGSSSVGWGLVIGGAAVFAGGATVFAIARGKASTLDGACPSHLDCSPALQSDYDAAKTLNAAGIALGVTGLVAAGVGVTLLAVSPSKTKGGDSAVVLSPRGVALRGQF